MTATQLHHTSAPSRASVASSRAAGPARRVRRSALATAMVIGVCAVLGCLTTLSGCQAKVAGTAKKEPGLAIVSLDVKGASTLDDDAHEALKEGIHQAIRERLREGPLVVESTNARTPTKAVVRFELMTDPEGLADSLILHLTADVTGEDAHGPFKLVGESWSALEAARGEDTGTLRARATESAAEEAVRQLVGQARVVVADDRQLTALMVDDSSEIILNTLREVARRDLAELAPSVAELLVHPSRDVVIIALATLGQLADPATATQVKDLIASPDPEKVERALYALADIGGEEAMESLRSVAARHPEQAVRALAKELLRSAALRTVH